MAKAGDTYVLHDGERVTVRVAAAESGGELLEMEAEWTPVELRPPAHLHPRQEERFEVHAGELMVKLEGTVHALGPGEGLTVPAGAAHAMWCGGEGTTRATWRVRPALRSEDFFAAVDAMRAAGRTGRGGAISLPAAALVLRAFPDEFRMPLPGPVNRAVLGLLALVARLRGYPEVASPPVAGNRTAASASIV